MKKILAVVIAVMMLATMMPLAAAAADAKTVDSLKVQFPDVKGVTFTFTDVLEQYYNDPKFQYGAITYLFFGDKGTISWDKDVKIQYQGAASTKFKAGQTYKIDDLNGYYFYNDANSLFYFFVKLKDATYDKDGAASSKVNGSLKDYALPEPTPAPTPEPTAEPAVTTGAAPVVVLSKQTVKVNGVEKSFEAYNIDGSNYFKLRDIAFVLNGTGSQFSVAYDEAKKAITCKTGEAYTAVGGEMVIGEDKSSTAVPSSQSLSINGADAKLTAYNIGGSNFIKLRDMGTALNFEVGYDDATKTVLITSK
jgi:hypothetical protein